MTKESSALDGVREVAFSEALGERYLSYALSTIMSRSLPDVRDGLKPVHRRLLYAMRQLKLAPGSGYKKSARVVGDVIGKFHPHGDQAIYDAMVRLAQDFAVRFPLVDGQGNFGNVDGDNAAAMRYTEARLTRVAEAMLDGIDEDTVDFRPTYDGDDNEPVVLPAAFPNLLANGASGIAVGMATSIPPHNVAEICQALALLIDDSEAPDEALSACLPGPDFPTGGIIVDPPETLAAIYRSGKGSVRLRARWSREDTGRGQYRIVITEIPYQVQKARLIEKIAGLIAERTVPFLADVRDESAESIRLVLEPKSRTVDANMLMETLFRMTDLESRFAVNMNALDGGRTPRVMSLRDMLRAFLDHRLVVLGRRTAFRIGKIEKRLEMLAAFLVAYLNLDEVIRIIRFDDTPRETLVARFDIGETQADAILNMRLRALHKLQELEIRKEEAALTAERDGLNRLLASRPRQWRAIAGEVADIASKFGKDTDLGRRHTDFGAAPAADIVPFDALIEREPITVICSKKGWIRALKGHAGPTVEVKYKEGDGPRFRFHAETTDKLLLLATNGRFYTIQCDRLPGGRGHGEPVRLMIDVANEEDIVGLEVLRPGLRLMIASSAGKGFVVEAEKVVAATRSGKQVLNVNGISEAAVCVPANGDRVAVVGSNRKLLIFRLDELPVMARGQGVVLQRYNKGKFSDATVFSASGGLSWPMGGSRTRTWRDFEDWLGRRGGAGRLAPKGFPQSGRFGRP